MKINYYPDGRWDGGGLLPRHLKDFSNLSEWIKFFLSEVKDLRKKYIEAVHNDRRLLGQEKANIVIEMDEVIGGLLLFRQYLSRDKANSFSSGSGKDRAFSIKLLDSTWTGSGRLSQSNELDNQSFSNLHNDLVMTKIKEVFTTYGEAGSDKNFSDAELDFLFEKIDSVFYELLRIERLMLYTNREN